MRASNKKKVNTNKTLFSDKAYLLIKKKILDFEISQREPISESKLAFTIGISRTPVREALKKLKAEGLLISSDKKGCFLNIPTLKEIKELYEIRLLLEGGATKLAAPKIDLAYLENFEKQFIAYKQKLDESSEDKDYGYVGLGKKFHFFIIESTQNDSLKEMLQNIYDKLEISRIFSYSRRGSEAIDEHLRIVEALREGDGEKSQRYMEEHLKNAYNTLIKIL